MKYQVDLAGRIARPGAHTAEAVSWLDRTMEHLTGIRNGTADPSIGGSMASGDIEISIIVESDSLEEAIARATSEIRGALDAASVGPDAIRWERLVAKTAVAAPAR